MLTDRTKLLMLIVGALVVVAVIVLAVLGVFPTSRPEPGPASEEAALELPELDEPDIGVENAVFDAANPGPVDSGANESGNALFVAARDAAEFFVERFGTYTNETVGASVNDLAGFMTPSMREWALSFVALEPAREGGFSIATEVLGSETIDFSPEIRSAEFKVLTRRAESSSGGSEAYEQSARLDLVQDSDGEWKVQGLFWEERG